MQIGPSGADVTGVLCDMKIPVRLKLKILSAVVRPVVMYCACLRLRKFEKVFRKEEFMRKGRGVGFEFLTEKLKNLL